MQTLSGRTRGKRNDLVVEAEAEATKGEDGKKAVAVAVRVARVQTGEVLKQIVSKKAQITFKQQ